MLWYGNYGELNVEKAASKVSPLACISPNLTFTQWTLNSLSLRGFTENGKQFLQYNMIANSELNNLFVT